MIFSLSIIHHYDRMSSITRILHTATWDFFTSRLPYRFGHSPSAAKEAIMTDIYDLVQELMTSSDGIGTSFFAMRRLFDILEECFHFLEVCFDIILRLLTYLIKIYRCPVPLLPSRTLTIKWESNLRYCLMCIGGCLITHCLNPKIWVICSGPYPAS